jgi:hypothetical protein
MALDSPLILVDDGQLPMTVLAEKEEEQED